jgi:hypothetical protein
MMKRQIYSCTLSGRCGAVCPEGVETPRALPDGAENPVSERETAAGLSRLLDTRHALQATVRPVCSCRRETEAVLISLFSRCQTAASMPEAVKKAYGYLVLTDSREVAMMLGCCGGAPCLLGRQAGGIPLRGTSCSVDWAALETRRSSPVCPHCQNCCGHFAGAR